MRPEVFVSSIALALIVLSLLAWKWRVKIRLAFLGGIIIGALSACLVSLINSVYPGLNITFQLLMALSFTLIITLFIIITRFYRDPERSPQETKGVILSPADGKVIYINEIAKGSSLVSTKGKREFKLEEIAATDFFHNATYLLGIEMNILNVHVNRSPIGGKVILSQRTKGLFISLRKQESEVVNQRVTTVFDNQTFKIGVIQITSRLVRKIVSYLKEGEIVDIGQRMGAIVFGSQVDVVIPSLENLKIVVKPGNEVKAGISVIARYG